MPIAPIGAAAVGLAIVGYATISGTGEMPFRTAIVLTAVFTAYLVGLMILPAVWIFERLEWRRWWHYVVAASVAGPIAVFFSVNQIGRGNFT